MAYDVYYPNNALRELVKRLNIQCLAITLTGRGPRRRPYKKRIKRIKEALQKQLTQVLDWGYRISNNSQTMILSIFSSDVKTPCCMANISQFGAAATASSYGHQPAYLLLLSAYLLYQRTFSLVDRFVRRFSSWSVSLACSVLQA